MKKSYKISVNILVTRTINNATFVTDYNYKEMFLIHNYGGFPELSEWWAVI